MIGYEDTPEDTPAGAHGTEYRENVTEKGIEGGGGDELEARQNADSSTHRELEKNTVLTAGTASRRGTRLSSIRLIPSSGLKGLVPKPQSDYRAIDACLKKVHGRRVS